MYEGFGGPQLGPPCYQETPVSRTTIRLGPASQIGNLNEKYLNVRVQNIKYIINVQNIFSFEVHERKKILLGKNVCGPIDSLP